MNISLDYDDTYTQDPVLWNGFCRTAKMRGHTVYCVSFRDTKQMDEPKATVGQVIGEHNCYGTGMRSKKDYMWHQHRISIDVWIDDLPQLIHSGV
jgi:hypothetical protein